MKATLTFNSGNEHFPKVYDDTRLELIRDELENILERELRVDIMYSVPGRAEMLQEVIDMITKDIDYEPTDEEMNPSEPPMTFAEMHSAAWAQKQELRK